MRQAADILSSAPAMQIRYLEAMQAMAKSANSKVIFLPAANQTMAMSNAVAHAAQQEAGGNSSGAREGDFGGQDPGLSQAIQARVVESM